MASDGAVTALSVAIAVALMCKSLSQHCYFHCCHNVVLVFAAIAMCISVSDRCGIPPVQCKLVFATSSNKHTYTILECSCIMSHVQLNSEDPLSLYHLLRTRDKWELFNIPMVMASDVIPFHDVTLTYYA